MGATYVHGNQDVIDYTPGSAVSSGDVVVQGDLVGVALLDIAASTLGGLATSGVFDVSKDTSTAHTVGTLLYWDVSAGEVAESADSGTNKVFGKAIAAAASADTTVRILKVNT